jgi:NAD(P)-dependent dehydrogenase (short-subunit alcohol dehydrogenase family)
MARIFITGSADGLGQLTAQTLIKQGHQVVLHARNEARRKDALEKTPGAEDVLVADLSNIEETKALAAKVNTLGKFDTVIHNAGIYDVSGNNADGLPLLFAVNCVAPYILTCLIEKPQRLIYLSSDMHLQGNYDNLPTENTKRITYSDTKLHDLILSMAVARKWADVYVNALHPGWVPTKMGGKAAPDSLEKGFETQVWLAGSNDTEAKVSGNYFHHKKHAHYLSIANDINVQEKLLEICEHITGIRFGHK